MIRVQPHDFDPGVELAAFAPGAGGICVFIGQVRDTAAADGQSIAAMTLEHYPGMTEKQLAALEAQARQRWPLQDVLIIHRYGRLQPQDRIVLVATAAAHRAAAFASCQFLMDALKSQAPFWKVEHTGEGDRWVEGEGTCPALRGD